MKRKFKNILLLTCLSIVIIYFINKIITFFATYKNLVNSVSGHYYEWRFGKIFYRKEGSGPGVLLVHDLYPGSSSLEFQNIIKSLSKTNTVYTLDLLGCGRSDKPNLTYTNYIYVQLITDFIKNIIGHKVDVIATATSGSFIALACHNDNSLFNRLILINPDSLYKLSKIPSKRSKSLKLLLETPIIGTLIYHVVFSKKNIKSRMYKNNFYNKNKVYKKYINYYHESSHLDNSSSKHLFSSLKGNYINMNIVHSLKYINNSIMIIGGDSQLDIDNTIENYMYFNPSIEYVKIKNTKYLPHLESPNDVLEQINLIFNN